MRDIPHFLSRLSLDHDADSRAIRRAYARELKLIDQERDAAGFQELREAYDVALRWAAHQAAQAAPAPADAHAARAEPAQMPDAPAPVRIPARDEPTASAAPQTPAPLATPNFGVPRTPIKLGASTAGGEPAAPATLRDEDPQSLARQAFDQFSAACLALAQRNHPYDDNEWQAAIRQQLASDALLNISARTLFEGRIAQLLAGGWRPGHQHLFGAAGTVFNWVGDHRRLQQFAYAGQVINQAIDQGNMYAAQGEAELSMQRRIIERPRDGALPENYQLRRHMPHLERMMARFPAWMNVLTDVNAVKVWRLRYQEIGGATETQLPSAGGAPQLDMKRGGGSIPWWRVLLFASIAVSSVGRLMTHEQNPPKPMQQPLSAMYIHAPLPPMGTAAPGSQPLSAEQRNDIISRVHYKPPANAPLGTLTVGYQVVLNGQGKVVDAYQRESSGIPELDAAFIKAIRESKPFPPTTMLQFKLVFTVTTTHKRVKDIVAVTTLQRPPASNIKPASSFNSGNHLFDPPSQRNIFLDADPLLPHPDKQ